ncbi:MAG: type II secretion system protein GspE [Candidatus Rokuibacteriota bacterium]|nr:MAG: type II secretion system protein GspE [Candidatus Rokubacteria bacterium]
MLALQISEEELRALVVDELAVVDKAEFEAVRRMAARLRIPLERALVERGRVPIGFVLVRVAEAWGVGFVDLKVSDVKLEALRVLTEEYARKNLLLPFELRDAALHVAMWNPRDRRVIDEVQRTTGRKVVPFLAPENSIRRGHLLYKSSLREMLERSVADETMRVDADGWAASDRSAAELLTRILEYAAVARASDIHIEPYELEILVRYRVDGTLREVLSLPPAALQSLVARVKILSQMRIDERRAPQDGRFEVDLGGFTIDFRVSTLPTMWGEKIVLRVLSREGIVLDLEDLGLTPRDHAIVLRNVLRPYGMILITGPTGSGKTTSLYSMLVRLGIERQNVVNISTIEDPIEYNLPRINQVAVNPNAGVEFATGLRALLRQDPDIIMVGEIRDRETVEIAVRAALVGRLLISTLHTNDATGVVPRLLDMGVEPFLLASTLGMALAQRLVRRICASCRQSVTPDASILAALRERGDFERTVEVLRSEGVMSAAGDPLSSIRLFHGQGCVQCNGSGFRGRLGVFEVFEVDDRIRSMIMERRDATAIRNEAIERGMKTMFQDGLAKTLLGETTLEEVFRVAP